MSKKGFDCVAMMHKGAEKIRDKTKKMAVGEELAFWKRETQKLKSKQSSLKAKGKSNRRPVHA